MIEKTIAKEPASRITIRFQDCDPFGHLNNARYLDYFINAREDHLVQYYDIDIYERQKKFKTNWVISKTQIAYMAPVFFRERVVIKTRLLQFNETEILMEGVMSNENETFAKSVVWINYIYFDLDKGRVVKHPEELMNHWRKISFGSPEIDMADFDGRVEQIKSQFQK